MRNRLTKIGAGIAAIAALAFGGSALASAAQKAHQTTPPAPITQQQGSQSAPDANATSGNAAETPDNPAEPQSATDGDNVQQGDQTSPDTASSTDQSSEQAGESASAESGPSDGPGGYADTNPNADTQQQGEH